MPPDPSLSAAPELHLFTAGLFSKWGFGDGDAPDDFLDWCDAQGIDYPRNWKAALCLMVRERLVPVLNATVEVVEINTSHNPIRASKVNGEDVEDSWYGDWTDRGIEPEFVLVPFPDVVEYVRRAATDE